MQPIKMTANKRKQHGLAEPAGTNGRFRKLERDRLCLECQFTAEESAVIVEKDWQAVATSFPPPIYRHRYGT